MPNEVIVIGAGGHGRVIGDIIQQSGDVVLGFLDDNVNGVVMGLPVLGKIADALSFEDKASFVIGIGNNWTRKFISGQYHLNWYTAIHPTAVIAQEVVIGAGTVVMAGAIINAGTRIGNNCIINTGAIIEHDNKLADFVHISPNATLCGTVSIGELTHIGAGATIINNLSVTHDSIIGAGAVVVKNIREPGTYVGVPAKLLKVKIDNEDR